MSGSKEQYEIIDYCSIRPNRLTFFSASSKPRTRSLAQINASSLLRNNEKSKDYSKKSKKRIGDCLAWLLELSKNEKFYSIKHKRTFSLKVNFITLTLSSKQIHSDNEIKSKLLDQFFTELRTKYNVEHYIWCAEPQKNGNIHFHITTNKYVAWWDIRKSWNRIQDKLGYTSRFFDKFGHNDPNSIDVHAVRNIKNLPAYLFKYFTKDNKIREIQGRRWGLSQSLSRLKSCCLFNYDEANTELSQIYNKYLEKVKFYDYADVLYIPFAWLRKMNMKYLSQKFDEYIENIIHPPPKLIST